MTKFKKTIFFRIFVINLITIIVSVVVFALTQSISIYRYVGREKINLLKSNAHVLADYIEAGMPKEPLEKFMHGFARRTMTDILVVDTIGEFVLMSDANRNLNSNALRLDEKYYSDVMSNRETLQKGTLGGVFKSDMLTLQVPIVASHTDKVVGAIFISTPVPTLVREHAQLFNFLIISLLLVTLISFVLSFALSKRLSKSIRTVSTASKQFAQGNFSSRVKLDKKTDSIIEINELTNTFNDMAYSLEKADQIRSNFLSDVAHELRTPMTTISGFVDGILDETIPPEKHRSYLSIVRDEVLRLSNIVNSFLDITRMQNDDQRLEIVNFDICETIRRTLVGFESKIEEKQIKIDFDFESDIFWVSADMQLIRRVLTNLFDNAVKFTDQGGLIKVSVKSNRQLTEISVYNTGCGIGEEDLKMIFERFYKADKSRSVNREGTGIGLFLVRDIINRHGMNITAKSVEGEYAEFIFTLNKSKI